MALSIAEGPQRRNSRNSCLRQGFGEARPSATREGGLLDEPGQSFSVAQTGRQRADRREALGSCSDVRRFRVELCHSTSVAGGWKCRLAKTRPEPDFR